MQNININIKKRTKNDNAENKISDNEIIAGKQVPEDAPAAVSALADPAKKPRWKAKIIKIVGYGLVFALVFVLFFSFFVEKSDNSKNSQIPWYNRITFVNQFKNLVESADKKLQGEDEGRINILLLGMGGDNHSGGYLTDTIMLASLDPQTKKVGLLSIPRDLTVPIEGVYGWRKINNINALAEQKEPGSGGQAVIQAIGDLLNLPIHYYVRVDFQGFIKIIDELGGITVDVENTLDDYSYPVMGRESAYPYNSRYEHLHIEKGIQEMDGELALKYARSRHAYGVEGSDFARARRQQKIIEAVKEKALSLNMLFRPLAIKNIIEALEEHVSTNLEIWEILRFWNLFKDIDRDQIVNKVLDNSPGGLLVSSVGDGGAYILVPKSGDFTEIQYLSHHLLEDAPAENKQEVLEEQVNIQVLNGTWINGLASKASVDLEKLGFNVTRVANCSKQNFEVSVIYDLNYGKKIKSLQILKQSAEANVVFGLPDWLRSDLDDVRQDSDYVEPDYILILGQDYSN